MSRKLKKKKIKLSPDQKKQRRLKKAFQKEIISTFKSSGFQYLNTEDLHNKFGLKRGEVDFVFLYENIILICEETIADTSIKEHMDKTKILFDNIKLDFEKHDYKFLDWLKNKYVEKFKNFHEYENNEYRYVFLYFHKKDISNDDISSLDYIKSVNKNTLKYLHHLSGIIKYSSMDEFFRFLGINHADIGRVTSTKENSDIDATIISPESSSGFKKMKIVSFLMKAEDIMDCGYVLRKDSWEDNPELYQRLLQKSKIKSIREYLMKEQRAFINNVIVSLPKDVRFYRKDEEIKFEDINQIENLRICIPKKRNSIGIIDGQHRIYSHYKSLNEDEERIISDLRKKLHILVTALVFDKSTTEREKRIQESKLFAEINNNTKKVSGDVLLHIKSLQDPYSPEGIARSLILRLNKEDLFLNKFEINTLNKSEIKTTSLIRYGLNEFVEINDSKETFYKYWDNRSKNVLKNIEDSNFEKIFELYLQDCFNLIRNYFKAVKNNFKTEWEDDKSKIFSIASINGFLLALKKTLSKYGIQGGVFYNEGIGKLKQRFDKDGFRYSSSKGWGDFSRKILKDCFDIE
jgi:DGQHR domain-containing protein